MRNESNGNGEDKAQSGLLRQLAEILYVCMQKSDEIKNRYIMFSIW